MKTSKAFLKSLAPFAMALVLLFALAACGGAAPEAQASSAAPQEQPEPASQMEEENDIVTPGDALQPQMPTPLTEEEEKLVGVWEAEDGSLVAVRPRGNREQEDFPFDAIYLEPVSGEWIKITREDTTFDVSGSTYTVSDLYMCPDPSDPEGGLLVETEERLEYDAESDTLLHVSRHPVTTGEVMEWTNTLTRTDKDPTDPIVEWAWYYDIHPGRQ